METLLLPFRAARPVSSHIAIAPSVAECQSQGCWAPNPCLECKAGLREELSSSVSGVFMAQAQLEESLSVSWMSFVTKL